LTSRALLAGIIAPLALAGAALASGTIVFDGSIGTGKPPRTLQGRVMLRFKRDTRRHGAYVTTVRGPTGVITFDRRLFHYIVKNAEREWRTWSNGYRGSVYADLAVSRSGLFRRPPKVKITLPPGTTAFYFYAEPNSLPSTLSARSGSASSGPVQVNSVGGAKFFGFIAHGGTTLTSVTIRSSDLSGFAIGEFGIHKR
jgi:hypothetical protein